jgi:hypothetical protein
LLAIDDVRTWSKLLEKAGAREFIVFLKAEMIEESDVTIDFMAFEFIVSSS